MKEISLTAIGHIETNDNKVVIKLHRDFVSGLKNLESFSHVNVIWWFDKCNNSKSRSTKEVYSPYKNAPEKMGVFATRSPERPNPIATTVAEIIHIDHEAGTILISFIDANNDSPVLDLKPYTPSLDRIEHPKVPSWCSNWPKSLEESADFEWSQVFN